MDDDGAPRLRAHADVGKGGRNQLSAESRAAYEESICTFTTCAGSLAGAFWKAGARRGRAASVGHSDPLQTATYLNVTEKGKESAIDRLDAFTAPREPQPPAAEATPPPVLSLG